MLLGAGAPVACVDVTPRRVLRPGDVNAGPIDSGEHDGSPMDSAPGAVKGDAALDTSQGRPPNPPGGDAPDAGIDAHASRDLPAPLPAEVDASAGQPLKTDAASVAPVPDAAAADVPLDSAPALPATGCGALSDVLFCEDFEHGLPESRSDWAYTAGGDGAIVSERSTVHGGSGAALVTVSSPNTAGASRYAYFYKKISPVLLRGPFYARFWVQLAPGFASPPWSILFELREASGGIERIKIVQGAGDHLDLYVTPAAKNGSTAAGTMQRNTWQCVELLLNLDPGTGGAAEFFVDGKSKYALSMVPTAPAAGWDEFVVGAIAEPTTPGIVLRLDDIVIATHRIGCR